MSFSTDSKSSLIGSQNGECSANSFDARMHRVMLACGVQTDASLARILGITQGAVGTARKRLKIPSGWIEQISKKFGVSTDWLFFGEGPMKRGDPAPSQEARAELPGEFTLIQKVKARLNAGTGSLETSGEEIGRYAFKTQFLCRKGNPGKMVLMDISGDSMMPVLEDGDTVLIDESQSDIIPGGMFAVGVDDAVFVKYVDCEPGMLILRSRNERYKPIEVPMSGDLAGGVRIIGRVVWSCREYGG